LTVGNPMNRKPKMRKYTKKDFDRQFPDDATCLEWLKSYLYPDGVFCEKCNRVTKHHRVASRPSYSCDYCGHHVHPTAGTIFHKSPTPLTLWFHAIYLMASTRCGISAKQIERETGVTYKTAWRMFKQIRSMLDESGEWRLGGKGKGVEVDEMYYGGRRKGGGGRRLRGDRGEQTKSLVVGMVERQGRVRALTAENASGATLLPIVKEHVMPSSTVFTDELPSYHGSFWSLVKRGIAGVYHSVGSSYLQTYLNEYSFRYNRRSDTQPMFISFLKQVEKRDAVVRHESIPVEPF